MCVYIYIYISWDVPPCTNIPLRRLLFAGARVTAAFSGACVFGGSQVHPVHAPEFPGAQSLGLYRAWGSGFGFWVWGLGFRA